MHTATLRALGGSLTLTLPKQLLKNLGLEAGSQVEIAADRDKIILTPRQKRKYTLDELLAGMKPGDMPIDRDWDTAPRAGKEVL
jgi:antitoxin MazE